MTAEPRVDEAEWTIGRLLAWTTEHLRQKDIEDARLASEILLADAIDSPRIELYTRYDQVPDADAVARFRTLVQRAAAREPVAYLVGRKEFYSLPFVVTRDVLIPRPETETLVEVVIRRCDAASLEHPRLLDIGTGSGCISVSLLTVLPAATVVASDISPAALEVARENARRNGVQKRATFVEADRLALPDGVVPDGGFDVIMSNPPYIARDEMDGVDATVREYEPHVALTDGCEGLTFYESMAANALAMLASDGVVVVEVADGKAQVVSETMCREDSFKPCGAWKDRAGGPDRVLMFQRGSRALPKWRSHRK